MTLHIFPGPYKADTALAPGIYFGLSHGEYHRDPALGSGDVRALMSNKWTWAWNRWSPTAKSPERDSASLKFGRALHTHILEGEAVFDATYCVKPEIPDNALASVETLKAECKARGLTVGGTKLELARRLRDAGYNEPLEPLILEDWELTRGEREVLSWDDYLRVKTAAKAITSHPHIASAFVGGFPEVSVFWERDGVPCKCRFDFLKPVATVDLKHLSNWQEMDLARAWTKAMSVHRYDIQAAFYMEGRRQAHKFIREGKVFTRSGRTPEKAWLERVAAEDRPPFLFVAYQSLGAPIARGWQFPDEGPRYERAVYQIGAALDDYVAMLTQHGPGIWLDSSPIELIADEDFAAFYPG
jgi:hypothetical protein